MSKTQTCRYCKKEIDLLLNTMTGTVTYTCSLGNDGEHIDYQDDGFNADGDESIWRCPECEQPLFNNEQAAIEFLKAIR